MAKIINFIRNTLLPEGLYEVKVSSASVFTEEGVFDIVLFFSILTKDFAGKTISQRYTLKNEFFPNRQEAGQIKFSNFLDAIGVEGIPEDSEDLVGKELSVKVGSFVGNDGEKKNCILCHLAKDNIKTENSIPF